MKKIILIIFIFICAGTSSYAYDNGIGVFAYSGQSKQEFVNVNSYCEIYFRCSATPGLGNIYDGYAYLKHGGALIHSFTLGGASTSVKYSGYWNTLEVGISCGSNGTIGLAELMW